MPANIAERGVPLTTVTQPRSDAASYKRRPPPDVPLQRPQHSSLHIGNNDGLGVPLTTVTQPLGNDGGHEQQQPPDAPLQQLQQIGFRHEARTN